MDPTNEQLLLLWRACSDWIAENQITVPETIYQTDRVLENAPRLIETVCNHVGYARGE